MTVPLSRAPAVRRMMGSTIARELPTPGGIARRRFAIVSAKLLLPFVALVLLGSLAIWPELQREADRAKAAANHLRDEIRGARMIEPRYRSVDEHGRPYTLTASEAQQVGQDRVNLTAPKGDITLQNGTWLLLQGDHGVYRRQSNELDLSEHVTLFRDDGTTMTTASAAIDLKNGAAAGSEPVHAQGPFGRLDAAGGFTAVDSGAQVQFAGPAHLLLSGAGTP